MFVVLLLIVLGSFPLQAAEDNPVELPFKVVNPAELPFDKLLAERLFYSAIQQVAREINPNHPPHIAPNMVLTLEGRKGGKPQVRYSDGVTYVTMPYFDSHLFAYACTYAASYALIDRNRLAYLAMMAEKAADAVIDVRELKPKVN